MLTPSQELFMMIRGAPVCKYLGSMMVFVSSNSSHVLEVEGQEYLIGSTQL